MAKPCNYTPVPMESDGPGGPKQPAGFVRKDKATIIAELESQAIAMYGPDVPLSPQSMLGQFIDHFANLYVMSREAAEAYGARLLPEAPKKSQMTVGFKHPSTKHTLDESLDVWGHMGHRRNRR